MRGTKRRIAAASLAASKPQPAVIDGVLDVAMRKGVRCCVECGATSTPQWREGPMGPKTLCNACGVRRQRLLRKQQTANTARVPTAPVAAVQARRRAARQVPASLSDEFHYGSGSGSENSSDETTEVEWAPTAPTSRQPTATHSRFRQPPIHEEPQDDCGSEEQSAAYDLLFLAGVDVSSAKQEGPNDADDPDTRQQHQDGDEEAAVEHEDSPSRGNGWRLHHVRCSSDAHKSHHISYYNAHAHHLPRHHNTRRSVNTARRSDDMYYYYEAGHREEEEGELGHMENEEEEAEQQRMGRGEGVAGVRKRQRVSSAAAPSRMRTQSALPPSPSLTPSVEDLNEASVHHRLPKAFSIDLSTLSLHSSGGAPQSAPPPVCTVAPIRGGSTVYQLGPYGLRVQMPQTVPYFNHYNTTSTSYQHQQPTNQADFLSPSRLVPLQPLHPAPPSSASGAASGDHHGSSFPDPSFLSPATISLTPPQQISPSACGRFPAPSTIDSPPGPLTLTCQPALPPIQLPLPAVTAKELEMLVHLQREFQRACLQLHQATAACEAVGTVVVERREAAESAREVATAASRLLASEVCAMADKYRLRDVLSELHGAMERETEVDTVPAEAAAQQPAGAGARGLRGAAMGATTV